VRPIFAAASIAIVALAAQPALARELAVAQGSIAIHDAPAG